MKPASRTLSYVVYTPNYVPGSGDYRRVGQLAEAYALARKWGVGSTFRRSLALTNRRHTQYISGYGPHEWTYEGERKCKP